MVRPLSLLAAVTLIFVTSAAVRLRAQVELSAPAPHPERAGRVVVTTPGGLSIEYSPGMEEDARELTHQLTAWVEQFPSRHASLVGTDPAPPPFSAQDMRDRSEIMLQHIAESIGRDAPSELQRACYGTFLAYYDLLSGLYIATGEVAVEMTRSPSAALWTKSELVERLSRDEQIPSFTYAPATDTVEYSLQVSAADQATPDERARLDEIEKKRLDHGFNYTVKDGVANLSASFTFKPGEHVESRASRTRPRISMDEPLVLQLVRRKENEQQPAPDFVRESIEQLEDLLRYGDDMLRHRDPALAFAVLHETIEAGIVEAYIGSPDRRWFCDGAANFLAWKIARELAGPEFARSVYNLEEQLERYREQQPHINLRKWPAVENQPESGRGTTLNKAHYAFATRAFFMMADKHGDDCIPALFREIGKTPRQRVNMKTVEKAFSKVTGGSLRKLLRAAERNPVPE